MQEKKISLFIYCMVIVAASFSGLVCAMYDTTLAYEVDAARRRSEEDRTIYEDRESAITRAATAGDRAVEQRQADLNRIKSQMLDDINRRFADITRMLQASDMASVAGISVYIDTFRTLQTGIVDCINAGTITPESLALFSKALLTLSTKDMIRMRSQVLPIMNALYLYMPDQYKSELRGIIQQTLQVSPVDISGFARRIGGVQSFIEQSIADRMRQLNSIDSLRTALDQEWSDFKDADALHKVQKVLSALMYPSKVLIEQGLKTGEPLYIFLGVGIGLALCSLILGPPIQAISTHV